MKNIKKINLAEVSDKQTLSMDQFSKIIGGSVDDTCSSGGGCAGGVSFSVPFHTKGGKRD